ncbi:hypothetical protein GCM10027594_26890 [Hymenobacter agri]
MPRIVALDAFWADAQWSFEALKQRFNRYTTIFQSMPYKQVAIDDEMFAWDVVPGWERSFGVRFAQYDFAQATTVGDVWAVVERHLIAQVGENPSGQNVACTTQRTFYRLRRALLTQGVKREAVFPKAQLNALFPRRGRCRQWRTLQQASELPLPALRMSPVLYVTIWALSSVIYWPIAPNLGQAAIAGLATALVSSGMRWLQWHFASGTLGELTADMVAAQYRVLAHSHIRNNMGEMRDIVLQGIARCGIEEEEIDYDELRDGTKLVF